MKVEPGLLDVIMNKYEQLFEYVVNTNKDELVLSFDKIEAILGFSIDHSFLSYKKELVKLGYEVSKISLKNKEVAFKKIATM